VCLFSVIGPWALLGIRVSVILVYRSRNFRCIHYLRHSTHWGRGVMGGEGLTLTYLSVFSRVRWCLVVARSPCCDARSSRVAVTVVCCYVVMLRGWIRPEDTIVMKSLWSLWLLRLMLFGVVCMTFLDVSSGVQ
jgi:hypothetical protein